MRLQVYATYFKAASPWLVLVLFASIFLKDIGAWNALAADIYTLIHDEGNLVQKFWVKSKHF